MQTTIENGQCGLCAHFGEHVGVGQGQRDQKLVSIVTTHQAELSVLDECGHPKNASLHLKVSPISGCDGFELAKAA